MSFTDWAASAVNVLSSATRKRKKKTLTESVVFSADSSFFNFKRSNHCPQIPNVGMNIKFPLIFNSWHNLMVNDTQPSLLSPKITGILGLIVLVQSAFQLSIIECSGTTCTKCKQLSNEKKMIKVVIYISFKKDWTYIIYRLGYSF